MRFFYTQKNSELRGGVNLRNILYIHKVGSNVLHEATPFGKDEFKSSFFVLFKSNNLVCYILKVDIQLNI